MVRIGGVIINNQINCRPTFNFLSEKSSLEVNNEKHTKQDIPVVLLDGTSLLDTILITKTKIPPPQS